MKRRSMKPMPVKRAPARQALSAVGAQALCLALVLGAIPAAAQTSVPAAVSSPQQAQDRVLRAGFSAVSTIEPRQGGGWRVVAVKNGAFHTLLVAPDGTVSAL